MYQSFGWGKRKLGKDIQMWHSLSIWLIQISLNYFPCDYHYTRWKATYLSFVPKYLLKVYLSLASGEPAKGWECIQIREKSYLFWMMDRHLQMQIATLMTISTHFSSYSVPTYIFIISFLYFINNWKSHSIFTVEIRME